MTAAYGVSWNDGKHRAVALTVAVFLAGSLLMMTPSRQRVLADSSAGLVRVIVQQLPGAGPAPEKAVRASGGKIVAHVDAINGFVADVPETSVGRIEAAPGVASVTKDRRVRAESTEDTTTPPGNTLTAVADQIGASQLWASGITGRGVDVAVIDSGVAPVPALAGSKTVNLVDISPDYFVPQQKYLDGFGHGTHMSGIVAGRDEATGFTGIAPDARIVNVKAADHEGSTSVVQLVMAINWVINHRYDNGTNIRVINLSFGADGAAGYMNDPLAMAVEAAWKAGIVVVVSAGNTGAQTPTLTSPGNDPFVLSVGADDTNGTVDRADDTIPAWSSPGDAGRRPDLVAPGRSIVSLRDPGSFLDQVFPGARVGDDLFRGSGTSQAAAVVSGAVALLLQQRPTLQPNQVKAILTSTAGRLPNADPQAQGKGLVDLVAASMRPAPQARNATQPFPAAGSRKTAAPSSDRPASAGGVSTSGNSWSGNSWSGNSWSGNSWSGNSWSGNSWSGNSWSGNSWSGNSWSGNSWSGNSWSSLLWGD